MWPRSQSPVEDRCLLLGLSLPDPKSYAPRLSGGKQLENGRGGWTPLRPLRGLQETRAPSLLPQPLLSASQSLSSLSPYPAALRAQCVLSESADISSPEDANRAEQ